MRLSASQWSPKLAKDLFSYGLYTFLGFLGKSLRSKSNPFIIASFLGITMVTHFRFAGMAGNYYGELVAALIGVFQPLLSQQPPSHRTHQLVYFYGDRSTGIGFFRKSSEEINVFSLSAR